MITREDFVIVKCENCDFHFTNPIPDEATIGDYYKSEEYISHSSSNKGLINKAYNVVRNITLKQKVNLLKRLSKGNQLLDIGAGTGHFLQSAKNGGFVVKGLEPDADAKKYAQAAFNISLGDLSDISSLPSASIDAITMWHVLEHVYHLKQDISEFVRVLKSDGVLIIAVPNMSSWDAQHYKEFWAAYDVPRHLYHFQEKTIKTLMAQFSMECIEILPMKFDAFYVSMLSEKYRGGNVVKGILNGVKSNSRAKNYGFSSQIYVFRKKEAI